MINICVVIAEWLSREVKMYIQTNRRRCRFAKTLECSTLLEVYNMLKFLQTCTSCCFSVSASASKPYMYVMVTCGEHLPISDLCNNNNNNKRYIVK